MHREGAATAIRPRATITWSTVVGRISDPSVESRTDWKSVLRNLHNLFLRGPLLAQVFREDRGTPVFLDVLDHQFGPLVVADERGSLRIVHGVRQVADEDAADAPFGHLTDSEGPAQDA